MKYINIKQYCADNGYYLSLTHLASAAESLSAEEQEASDLSTPTSVMVFCLKHFTC